MIIRCPGCNQKYDLKDEFAGQSIECQSCGISFKAPKPIKTPQPQPKAQKEQTNSDNQEKSQFPRVSLSGVLAGWLVIAAVIVAVIGILTFSDPAAQSAIHQIFFALRTLAYLAGSIIILLIAILVKMK